MGGQNADGIDAIKTGMLERSVTSMPYRLYLDWTAAEGAQCSHAILVTWYF